jgi:hypothetical protein
MSFEGLNKTMATVADTNTAATLSCESCCEAADQQKHVEHERIIQLYKMPLSVKAS